MLAARLADGILALKSKLLQISTVLAYRQDMLASFWHIGFVFKDPLSPNSDQHQISPCNINAYSTPEVTRIKDMITQY